MLTKVPNMADFKIAASLDKALKIWKPKIVDMLTIKIMGAVICKGSTARSKLLPNSIKIISGAHSVTNIKLGKPILSIT